MKSVDALMDFSGKTDAYIINSIPSKINTLSLVSGRLPKTDNECVVDSKVFDENDIEKTIKVINQSDSDNEKKNSNSSINNAESSSDNDIYNSENSDADSSTATSENSDTISTEEANNNSLTESTFTITGIVNSPLYLGNDRGTTSIGNGTPKGFIYVPDSAFDTDYFTEIDITLTDSAEVYSDEYDDIISDIEDAIKSTTTTAADSRYESIVDDIEEQAKSKAIDSATAEINSYITSSSYPVPNETKNALIEEATNKAIEEIPDKETLAKNAGLEKPTTYVLTRNENAGYLSFKNDTSILSGIANIFPIFFVLIAMLISITTISRMVEEERSQIGTLKALGYSDSAITMKYLMYSGSAALIGDISGFFLGTYFIPKIFWMAYNSIYDFAPITFVFSLKLFLITLIVSMAGILGSTYFSCRSELMERPAALIRPKVLKSGKRILLERIQPLWSRLTFLQKITLRNMFRYKERLIMMLVGISLCTALLVTSFGVRDSMINISTLQFDNVQKYDIEAGFSLDGKSSESNKENSSSEDSLDSSSDEASSQSTNEVSTETTNTNDDGINNASNQSTIERNIKALGEVKRYLPVRSIRTDIKSKEESMSAVPLYAFKNTSNFDCYFSLKSDAEEIAFPSDGDAAISKKIAETLNLKTGDAFDITDSDMNKIKVRVSGIFDNYIGNFIIISSNTYEGGLGKYEPNTFLISLTNRNDSSTVAEKLTDISAITSVTKLSDTKDQVDNALSCVNYIIVLMVVFSGLLAFIVIFNLTNINLAERSREIATVEVLGFYEKETNDYVLRENIMSSVMAAVIGLPVGALMHDLVMNMIVVENMEFDIHVSALSFILSVAFTILFAVIVNIFM